MKLRLNWWGLERQPGAESPNVVGVSSRGRKVRLPAEVFRQGICILEDGILVWDYTISVTFYYIKSYVYIYRSNMKKGSYSSIY